MKKDEFFAQMRTAFAGMDEELIMDIIFYENLPSFFLEDMYI